MNAAEYEIVVEIFLAAEAAGHGKKGAIKKEGAKLLGISEQTLAKWLKKVVPKYGRKRRSDAGRHTLTRTEAAKLAAYIEETRRLTGIGAVSLTDAAAHLRKSDPEFIAGSFDPETGEFKPLSASAMSRGMYTHGFHPTLLAEPSPAMRLSSPCPNWCWQIDASLCRQFYLADAGTVIMDKQAYYRGKPHNFEKISDRRLWRYAITDHCSGYIELFYVQGSESQSNLIASLIHAMTERAGSVMHGVPKFLMCDPGSGNTGATTGNFCRQLGIQMLIHRQGNSRETGQVEGAHSIIETHFEAPLKMRAPVTSITEMNMLAALWVRDFNATRRHSRHGMTRRDAWLRITPEQLQLAPSVDVLRTLATTTPKECTVRDNRIRFKGKLWDVQGLPDLLNGSKQLVVSNPFDPSTVRILLTDEAGREFTYAAPELGRDEYGFDSNAREIGSGYRTAPETPTQAARREIERIAMDAATDEEAAEKRKAKRLAFGGRADPSKLWSEAEIPVHIPRAGTPSTIEAPKVIAPVPRIPEIRPRYEPTPLGKIETAQHLKRGVEARGGTWSKELFALATSRWPNGVTEEQLTECVVELMRASMRVAGGAA